MTTAAGGHGGRHFRFALGVAVLGALTAWLWTLIIMDVAANRPLSNLQLALTAMASLIALALVVSVWRNPVGRHVRFMTTPALRQGLATHHAGHIVATYLNDPTRIRRADLAQPCHSYRRPIAAIAESSLRTELTITLSGLAAEELFCGESGSHSAADLNRATTIAADMVGRYGMAGSLVSLHSAGPRRKKFISHVLNDPRTRKELEALLREAKRETVRSLLENRHLVVALRDAIARRGRLGADEVREVINGADTLRRSDDEVLVDLRIVGNRPAAGQM